MSIPNFAKIIFYEVKAMFCDTFISLLEEHNKTALQVAKDLSIPKSIVYEWKSGKRVPSADKLMKLSEYFGVSMAYLLGGAETLPSYDDNSEKELALMLRAARQLSPEDHDELVETLKKNVALYLRAKGQLQ